MNSQIYMNSLYEYSENLYEQPSNKKLYKQNQRYFLS